MGNILYRFPSLQRTASAQRIGRSEYVGKRWTEWVDGVEKFFKERKWMFRYYLPLERIILILFFQILSGTAFVKELLSVMGILHSLRSLSVIFQNYLQQVLPAILDGPANENESVCDAALSAGYVLVEHYATMKFIGVFCLSLYFFLHMCILVLPYIVTNRSLPLLLPTVKDGIFNDNWHI